MNELLEISMAMKEELRVCLEEYMNDKMGGSGTKDSRFNYIYSRLLKILSDIMERLCGEFASSDFEPCDFELSIKRDGDVRPFTLTLEKGTVQIRGIIDRVDKMDMDGKRFIRVVDYKTGGKTFELSDVLEGLNMQMLLYLVSIWRNGKGDYENIIPAGVLYYPARTELLKSKREDSADEILRKRYIKTKMHGLLVDDEQIIRRMDKKEEGLFLPVSFDKKTGEIKGNLISLEALERLASKMDTIIKNMGNSLHCGNVDARPLMGEGHTNTCEYCDYGDVCMVRKPNYRYIEKMSHDECIQEIMKEDVK